MPALVGFLILLGAMYHLFFRFDRWHSADKPGVIYEHDNLTGDTRTIQADGRDARTRVSARILGEEGGLSDDLRDGRDGLNGYGPERLETGERADSRESMLNPWGEPVVETLPDGRSEERRASERSSRTNRPIAGHIVRQASPQVSSSPGTQTAPPSSPPVPGETEPPRNRPSLARGHGDEPVLKSWDWRDERQVEKASRPVPVPKAVMLAAATPPVPHRVRVENVSEVHAAPFAVRKIDLNRDGSNEEIIQSADGEDGLLNISIVQNGREIFFGRGRQIALLPSRTFEGWADIALKANGRVIGVFRYNPRQDAYTAN
jgi:hypothetical protein